jgi:hypothetical protein
MLFQTLNLASLSSRLEVHSLSAARTPLNVMCESVCSSVLLLPPPRTFRGWSLSGRGGGGGEAKLLLAGPKQALNDGAQGEVSWLCSSREARLIDCVVVFLLPDKQTPCSMAVLPWSRD